MNTSAFVESQMPSLAEFMETVPAGEFRPFAYYDKHLDCIRVQIRDCSVIDDRMNHIVTMLRASHPTNTNTNEYVGFTIKGVRELFDNVGLPKEGVLELTKIIHRIVEVYPTEALKILEEEFFCYAGDENLTVDFDLAA